MLELIWEHTVYIASSGTIETIETVVSEPKDPVARNFLGKMSFLEMML